MTSQLKAHRVHFGQSSGKVFAVAQMKQPPEWISVRLLLEISDVVRQLLLASDEAGHE
jgi:hypothetical protein